MIWNPFEWLKIRKNTKKRGEEQDGISNLHDSLVKLHTLFLAIEGFLSEEKGITRGQRKKFWYDFHKRSDFRSDLFNAMLKSNNISEAVKEIACKEC